jgi:hypothetical protein
MWKKYVLYGYTMEKKKVWKQWSRGYTAQCIAATELKKTKVW